MNVLMINIGIQNEMLVYLIKIFAKESQLKSIRLVGKKLTVIKISKVEDGQKLLL